MTDVPRLLDTWDVAVQFSTRPEPLGQNVLQYLAAGCAVVVADEGGPAEWIEDGVNGLRVTPRDVGALAEALRALDADDRSGTGSRGRPRTPLVSWTMPPSCARTPGSTRSCCARQRRRDVEPRHPAHVDRDRLVTDFPGALQPPAP